MNQRKEEDTTEADFIIRSYTKAELAQLYCPGLDPVLALQKLYRWMRKNTAPGTVRSQLQQIPPQLPQARSRADSALPGRTLISPQRRAHHRLHRLSQIKNLFFPELIF